MATSPQAVTGLAAQLIAALAKDHEKNGRLGLVHRYLKGEHDLPYAPRGAKLEYRSLAEKSVTNWLPLISDTYAKALWVEGYRRAKSTDNAEPWSYWQANRLDARQAIAHRGALDYGVSHVLVLPGDPAPLMKPLHPMKCQAFYEDDDDEWPVYGLVARGKSVDGASLYQLLDDEKVFDLVVPKDEDTPRVVGTPADHGLGVTPLVRFRDRLDGEATGIIRPLIRLQDRINEAVFALMIAIQYASFRQRWATGLAIPEDEETGKPVEPFQAAVDRLWISDNPEAKFGDFAQTEVSGHIANYDSAVRTLAAIAQTPPHVLMGDLVNLSADALAAAQDSTTRKGEEYETLFGESWEQGFRLAAKADGKSDAAKDSGAQVRWRDTEARALASTVDALGKMAQMLEIPAEALWERVPGVSQQDVENWKALAKTSDGLKQLAAALTANAEAAQTANSTTTAPPPATPGAPAA